MRKLGIDIDFDSTGFEKKITELEVEEKEKLDKNQLREQLRKNGFEIKKINLSKPNELSFIACDASILKKELMYQCLWGAHTVIVRGTFNGQPHQDNLSGRLHVWYDNLEYESLVDFGSFKKYASIDERLDSKRVGFETQALMNFAKPEDVLLLDGSIYSSTKKIEKRTGFLEHDIAKESLERLKEFEVVAMVEDTHDNTISRKLYLNTTDLLLFEIVLEPNEYVYFEEGVNVCYIKLGGKNVEYSKTITEPIVVRWELNCNNPDEMLNNLASIWMIEDDLVHPQLYPIRVADYMTRKIKVSGILDTICEQKNLRSKYRDNRTV